MYCLGFCVTAVGRSTAEYPGYFGFSLGFNKWGLHELIIIVRLKPQVQSIAALLHQERSPEPNPFYLPGLRWLSREGCLCASPRLTHPHY
jgi:hypothetical protein